MRKRIVTEQVTRTVPVAREQATVVREPITEANVPQATDGPALSEEEHEVVLDKSVPVVSKGTVPVERVRWTRRRSPQERVTDQVRKEQIGLGNDGTPSTADPAGR